MLKFCSRAFPKVFPLTLCFSRHLCYFLLFFYSLSSCFFLFISPCFHFPSCLCMISDNTNNFLQLKERREERGYWRRVLATAVRSVYPNIDFKIKEFTSSSMHAPKKNVTRHK